MQTSSTVLWITGKINTGHPERIEAGERFYKRNVRSRKTGIIIEHALITYCTGVLHCQLSS